MARASKGGQTGMNGEWYEGGQFLPNTQLTKMARPTRTGSGKVQVEPYVWVQARDGFRPIFGQFPYHPAHHLAMRERVNPAYVDVARLDALYSLWIAGERWIAA